MSYFIFKSVAFCLIATIPIAYFGAAAQADVASLDSLANGATLTEGDTLFSNFSIIADDGTVSPDFTQILVETISGPTGLEFQGQGEFALGPGIESIIFQVGFDATTTGVAWNSSRVDLSQGIPMVGAEGLIDVLNSISNTTAFLTETNATIDPLFGINEPTDDQLFGSLETALSFETSLTLFSDTAESVSLDSFRITVSSVPEPTGVAVIAMVVGPLFFVRRRSC